MGSYTLRVHFLHDFRIFCTIFCFKCSIGYNLSFLCRNFIENTVLAVISLKILVLFVVSDEVFHPFFLKKFCEIHEKLRGDVGSTVDSIIKGYGFGSHSCSFFHEYFSHYRWVSKMEEIKCNFLFFNYSFLEFLKI